MSRPMLIFALSIMLTMLFVAAFIALNGTLRMFVRRRRRIRLTELGRSFTAGNPPRWLMLLFGIRFGKKSDVWAEWGQLLASAGFRIQPLWYICLKRMTLVPVLGTAAALWIFRGHLRNVLPVEPIVIAALAGGATVCLMCDRYMLESMKRYRTNRIVEEIYTVSRQLLYFAGSPLNFHSKLSRCLPYTKLIRREWHLLLNDWYHDAEGSITRFRYRLGTEEAYSFSETLQSLRLYDSDEYYSLLRQRVQDFKERLELLRDSRKESASYALFVLAGIPILYTFQIFIHPWVQEGKRLFETLQ